MNNIIELNLENIEKEHICCAISDKKGENRVKSKKDWLKDRIKEGLVFAKLDIRGKVFIEYIPGEHAWAPIEADGYMYINCFWVSGKYKGKGNADKLLNYCIEDAKRKNKKGLVVLSSETKKPFLSDPKHLKYKGFKVSDKAKPYYELLYYPFDESYEKPRFKEHVKDGVINTKGWTLYYSNQCPHTEKYALKLVEEEKKKGINIDMIKITDKEKAQNAPNPFTTYSLFYEGEFITNEILTEKSFEKLLGNI